jgi:AAA family ATP:ADP antiporter
VVLMLLMPLYTAVRRRIQGPRLIECVLGFFVGTLLVFCALFAAGVRSGFAFFVWVSIFGVAVIAQFWAFAADTFNPKSGQRLFPVIMVGANLGALAGAQAARVGSESLAPVALMLLATGALVGAIVCGRPARDRVPDGSRAVPVHEPWVRSASFFGGIALVMRDRYLALIAVLVVLLNWINTTGEFILSDVVKREAGIEAAAGHVASAHAFITGFYGSFNFWITLLGLAIQLFLVARIFRYFGVRGALLVMPIIVALGYGLIVFVPVFAIIRGVKILENSIDYTLMNTTRQALFLPVSTAAKYDGKTAIDTFFWRLGDLLQAAIIFVGLRFLNLDALDFAQLNLVLALFWIALSVVIGRRYAGRAAEYVLNVAPQAAHPIPDLVLLPGASCNYVIALDAFSDPDPGDVLRLRAQLENGSTLPSWLRFDPDHRRFTGSVPCGGEFELRIEVIASDVDGSEVSSTFVMRCAQS